MIVQATLPFLNVFGEWQVYRFRKKPDKRYAVYLAWMFIYKGGAFGPPARQPVFRL